MESEEATLRRQARQREYYLKHRDKMLAYSRKYIKEHPEKQKLYRENAAKKRANGKGYYQRYYLLNKEKICADLEAEGYSVQPIVIPACAIGAPHRRDRVWIIAHTQCDGHSPQGHGNQRARAKKSEEGQDRPQPRSRRLGSGSAPSYTSGKRHGRWSNKQESFTECSRTPNLGTRRSKRLASNTLQHRSHQVHQDHQSQFPDGARSNSLGGQWSSSHSYGNGGKTLQPSEGTERTGCKRDVQPKERSTSPEWTDRLSRLQQSGRWRNFPTQSPVCRGNDGIPFDVDSLTISFPKWRQESIKAYGNAWVPQVAYEIFRAIEAEENK